MKRLVNPIRARISELLDPDGTAMRGPSWSDVAHYAVCAVRGHTIPSMQFSQFCGRCGWFIP